MGGYRCTDGLGVGDIDDWMIIDDESLRWIWSLDVEM